MNMHNVLACTIGATPQVVTETVWSLMQQVPAWIPHQVHIVTTAYRLPLVRSSLQASDGQLASLMTVDFPSVTIHVPRQDGTAHVISSGSDHPDPQDLLQDINSEQESAIMGNLILRLFASITADPDTALHVSLAGGRKTMSAHALMALSMVGRPRDRASHVLVGPLDYEDHPGFWYPSQLGLLLKKEQLRLEPKPKPTLDPSLAEITLIPTPTPLMRHRVQNVAELEKLDLVDLVRRANLAAILIDCPHVLLKTKNNSIVVGGVTIRLGPKLFALYRLLAAARQEGWCGAGPEGIGDKHAGWLTFERIVRGRTQNGQWIRDRMGDYLEDSVNAISGDAEDSFASTWANDVSAKKVEKNFQGVLDVVSVGLNPNITNLKKELVRAVGPDAAALLAPIRKTSTVVGQSRFGLSVPPGSILIEP
ncbi:MAG: TIGR02584 family CRISPR-associated protein [Magnetococcales bacterium]|nr:TIGR02584 family CRISPR-associated protein [Magnetococcales bacterium]